MSALEPLFGDDADILRERGYQALILTNILPSLGTALLSPILDSLIDPLQTTAGDIGLIISVFTAPAIVIIPVAGALSDRYGRKPILVTSLLLFGLTGTAIAFTTEYRVVLGLRLLQGVAFGGLTPVIITSLGDIYDGDREATAQGIRFTGSGITQTVFPLLSGFLVVLGWQYPFLLYAVSFPVAVLVYLWFSEPTEDEQPTKADDTDTVREQILALFGLVTQYRVAAIVVARGLPLFVWYGFVTYNSLIVVRTMDGTPSQAGIVTAVASIMFATGASQAGRITVTFDSRFYPLVGANLCLGAGFGVFLFAPALVVGAAGIMVTGIGFGLSLALYRSVITGLTSEALRGSLVSFAESFGRAVATVVPVVMGIVISALTPRVGLMSAIQIAGLGGCVIGTGGGLLCLLMISRSPSGFGSGEGQLDHAIGD